MSTQRIGGPIFHQEIRFSPDGRLAFCCVGRQVAILHTGTGNRIGVLDGHRDLVTAVELSPRHAARVWTASLDGTIRCWDYYEPRCLQVYRLTEDGKVRAEETHGESRKSREQANKQSKIQPIARMVVVPEIRNSAVSGGTIVRDAIYAILDRKLLLPDLPKNRQRFKTGRRKHRTETAEADGGDGEEEGGENGTGEEEEEGEENEESTAVYEYLRRMLRKRRDLSLLKPPFVTSRSSRLVRVLLPGPSVRPSLGDAENSMTSRGIVEVGYETCFKVKQCRGLTASQDGLTLATISGRDLSLWDVRRQRRLRYEHVREFTTVTFHPSQPLVATGDSLGVILLWQASSSSSHKLSRQQQQQQKMSSTSSASSSSISNRNGSSTLGRFTPYTEVLHEVTPGGSPPKLTTSSMHWHAHRVGALCFTEDGSYLLSGGEESVLVAWQLGTEHRQFLPRLGAPIAHISVTRDGELYAVSGMDNTVRFIQTGTMKISRRLMSVQYGMGVLEQSRSSSRSRSRSRSRNRKRGRKRRGSADSDEVDDDDDEDVHLLWDRKQKTTDLHRFPAILSHPTQPGILVFEGVSGVLQFYDVLRDMHVGQVEVVVRNTVSRFDSEDPTSAPAIARITAFAFSPDGEWLVTADRRVYPTGGFSDQSVLQFWNLDPGTQKYFLHTLVKQAHGQHPITAIHFHPQQALRRGSGGDGGEAEAGRTVVTGSPEGSFKLWSTESKPYTSRMRNRNFRESPVVWKSLQTGKYRAFSLGDVRFSPEDGSVLAVSHAQIVTLWRFARDAVLDGQPPLQMIDTLVRPPPGEAVRENVFLPAAEDGLLIAATDSSLYLWSLLRGEVLWSRQHRHLLSAAVHPSLPYFAILTADTLETSAELLLPLIRAGGGRKKVKHHKKRKKKGDEGADDVAGTTLIHRILVFHGRNPEPVAVLPIPDLDPVSHQRMSRNSLVFLDHPEDFTMTIEDDSLLHPRELEEDPSKSSALPSIVEREALAVASGPVETTLPCLSLVYVNRDQQLVRCTDVLTMGPESLAAEGEESDEEMNHDDGDDDDAVSLGMGISDDDDEDDDGHDDEDDEDEVLTKLQSEWSSEHSSLLPPRSEEGEGRRNLRSRLREQEREASVFQQVFGLISDFSTELPSHPSSSGPPPRQNQTQQQIEMMQEGQATPVSSSSQKDRLSTALAEFYGSPNQAAATSAHLLPGPSVVFSGILRSLRAGEQGKSSSLAQDDQNNVLPDPDDGMKKKSQKVDGLNSWFAPLGEEGRNHDFTSIGRIWSVEHSDRSGMEVEEVSEAEQDEDEAEAEAIGERNRTPKKKMSKGSSSRRRRSASSASSQRKKSQTVS